MGGGGKGASSAGSQTYTEPQSSTDMTNLAKQLFAETSPLRTTLEQQGLEALKTGGTAASIPSIQKAVESSKTSLSNAMRQITGSMAGAGLGGTPYAESTKAGTEMQGELGVSNAANQVGQWFMSMLPNLLTGQQSAATNLFQDGNQGAIAAMNASAGSANQAMSSNTAKGNSLTNAMMSPFNMFKFGGNLFGGSGAGDIIQPAAFGALAGG